MAEINGPGKDNVIHIGDIISLKFPKLLSYLSAEGILSEDVYVSPSTHFFEEHLFQVYVQRQYSATNELEEFMEGLEAEGHDITKPPADPSTASHMEALVKGKDNEFVLNKSVMKSKTGNVVCFGDTIQLLHVKSNKYITVKPADLARDERENMKVALSHDGSVMSWLKVMPRFKIDREGEPITNGTEVLLRIAERSTEFIHCADRAPPKGKFREVNSSMEVPTGWKLSVFHKTSDIKNVAHLLTGQLVSIKDPELQCMLAPLAKKIDLDPPVSESKPSTAAVGRKSMQLFQTPHSSASLPVNQEDDESDAALDDQSLASKDEFLRDYGSVVLRPMLEDIVDSDTLWMVETRAITRGGQIKFLTDRVHLRHFNTGKYLAVDQNEYDPDLFFLSLEDEPNDKRTLFFITELHSSIEFLGNAKAVQIKHAYHGAYLQRGIHHDEQRVYTCTTTRSKSKAVSMIINRYEQKEGINVIKSLQMKEETLDIYFGKAVMYHIEKFVKATAVPLVIRHDSASIWPRIDVTDRAFFSTLMGRTTLFVRGYPIHIRAITDEMATGRGRKHVVVRRQNMFREQGLLQAMMIMIKFLQPISDLLNSDSGNSRVAKSQFVENGREILSDCLHLLYDLIHENMVNQLYISDHLLIIFSHVSSDKMAAKIAQELLSSNRELQETKVGEREITIFTAKMREVHMNSMYLQLLQTCCSCMGEGLPKNQEIVRSVLFQTFQDVLIKFQVDYNMSTMTEWNKDSKAYELFIEPRLGQKMINGEVVVTQGIPSMSLTWNVNSTRFSAMQLYKKNTVPISEVMLIIRSNARHLKPSQSTNDDARKAVADFLVAQLQLAAEMCLGRNYPIIGEIEKLYSYEMLISIIKSSNSEMLQSAAAYLLLKLYVDRDPQSEVQLPRLTRILSEISKKENSELVCIVGAEYGKFSLVQFLIANHLESIKGKAFPLYSYDMFGLLHELVRFNFYGQVEILQETIESLMQCLKRDDNDLNVEGTGVGMSSSLMKLSVNNSSKSTSRRATMHKSATSKTMSSNADDEALDKEESKIEVTKLPPREPIKFDELAQHVLENIESLPTHLAMAAFAMLASACTVYTYMTGYSSFIFDVIEYGVLYIFAIEIILHITFHRIVRKELLTYFSDVMNILDIATCVLYGTHFLFLSSTYAFVKLTRLIRLVILVRVYYAIKAAQRLRESMMNDNGANWAVSARHQKTNAYTLKTMVRMVNILNTVQKNIDDRMLSLFLKRFKAWSEDPRANVEQAKTLFKAVVDESATLTISNEEHDNTLIDVLFYSDSSLVQSTLNLLMNHHSSRRTFLDNINKLQLITSVDNEGKYFRLEKIVNILKRHADTHEIWGKLENADFRDINVEMHKYLLELTAECKKLRETLKFDEMYEPVKYIQNILRNLGCFDVCIKVAQLVLHINPNDTLSDISINTRTLALEGNRLLHWLILDNPANQALAYGELKFFIKTIDIKVDSHRVISAIFRNNIELMELVPKKYIAEFVDMVCNVGRFPQYLSLMSSIINVGEKNVIANQYEVIKLMTSPENQKKIVHYFTPVSHQDYAKKIRLMSSYLNVKDVSVDELPSDLAYHLELMKLLSSCTVGRSGMTTIEAKVQSMFHFVDIVEAMLDPNCLLLAKIRLGSYLYNAVLDVETPVPAIKDAACVWKILIAAQDVFTFAKDELRQIEKNGWGAATSNRQKIEYMIVNAMIVESYFTAYFDRTIFKPEIGQTAFGVERVSLKEAQGNEIIRSLYTKLSALYEMLSPLITEEHHNILYSALVALNNAAKEKMIAEVENIHESFLKNAEEYEIEGADKLGKAYDNFIVALNQSTEVKENIDEQIQHFINKIEEIPWKKNAGNAPVAFEPLVEKLVHHVRGCVRLIVHGEDSMKYMDAAETKTGIWILRIFRTMIENRWGMTIYERDDDGGEEQDDAVVDLMDVYNESGVTEMCLDLIAKGIDIALQAEALKLLVGMLFKEGGALDIQKSIHAHLAQPGSDMFFRTVRHILHNLMSWHKWNGIIVLEGDAEPELPDEIIIVRCLQLMCEGHYGPNQDIMREQPNNNVSINLLDDFVLYLQCLDPIKCRTTTTAELAVSATILEVIQGPCEGNQDYFALSTELIETLNRKLRQHPVHDCDEEQEMELKKGAIDIFQALLEGQGRKTAVYERMLSVIHVDVILVLCKGEHEESEEEVKESKKAEEEESDISVELRTESLVLLQMLTDFRPTLKKELGLDEDMSGLGGDSVACIEVVWRGELQRRFFHIPDICQSLAKSTKDNFILNVKRASAEDKLYGLLETSKEMYREVLHQEFLKAYKIDTWFSRTTMDRCIWANFYIVLTINVLFVLFYTTRTVPCIPFSEADDGFNQYIDTTYDPDTEISTEIGRTCTEVLISNKIVISSITALNIALICLATFTLVSTLVVRAPVNFQAYVEDKKFGYLKSIVYTAMDFMTLYYGSYLALAYVGLIYQPTLSFLLLDFIQISPTTQAVLRAVYNPRKQIFMTLVLTFIIMYIFAIFQFFFVNNSDNFTDYPTTITLGNMYKFLLRWGLPYNTPQNQMVLTIYSFRVVSDLAFFMSCLIMLNILKGITIDTFVELRKSLEARMDDTTLKCFICGIEKNTFNRTLDRTAFALHIKHDQNLWNYLYFIMYVWQQDKDDDDGLESYVRKCIASNDLIWFPMNKAIRLAEHIAKGDVHSIKYKFRKDMERSENIIYSRMNEFKEQVSRTITRVEKALEYENEESGKRGRAASRQLTAPGKVPPNTPGLKSSLKSGKSTANVFSRQGTEDNLSLVGSISTLDSARSARGDKTPAPRNVNFNMDAITSAPPPQRAMVHSTTALDADNLGQMHMRIVYISGMIINPSHMKFIRVRVITEFQTSAVKPIKEVQIVNSLASPAMAKLNPGVNTKDSEVYATRSMEKVSAGLRNTRSSFSLNSDAFNNLKKSLSFSGKFHKTGGPKDTELDPSLSQTQIRFDILDNPAILVHQGSLPKSDLSKIMVKIQILFGTEEPAFDDYSDMTYLAGVKVPLIQLIAKAHDGGLLEVPFRQREVEVNAPAREISASDFVTFKTPPKTPPKSPMLSPPDSSRGMLRSPPGESISRTVTLPENDQCVIAMSAIASYKLLQDFALIRS